MHATRTGAFIILTSLWSVSLASQAAPGVSDTSIRLGMVNVQTGPAEALGQGMLEGAAAVFDEVNASGGIHSRQIELLVADDGYEPDLAIDETLIMIEEQEVFSLFGFVGTPTANAVLPIVQDYDVPLVGLFTGAGTLRDPLTRQVFNVRSSYNDETEAMVQHFLDRGAETVAVFYQNDGFGQAVLAGTTAALDKRGMSVHAKGTFERNTLAVQAGLADMINANPDAIVMVGTYAPLAEFVRLARDAGLDSMMATVSFVGTNNLISAVGDAGEGVLITQVVPYPYGTELAVVNDCRDLLDRHAGTTLGFINLEGCLSAKVMVEGLRRSGQDLSREALIDSLESIKDLDLGGVRISYSTDDHQGMKRIFMTEIRDGKAIEIN